MAVHAARTQHFLHDHTAVIRDVTRVAAVLLAAAATLALGAAGLDFSVLAIRVLTPIAFLGSIALMLDDQA